MPKNCSIPGCTSRKSKEHCKDFPFYSLPQEPNLRHRWLVAIKKRINVTKYTYVCGLHFDGGKKNAENPLPSIFPWSEPPKRRQPPKSREPLPIIPKKRKLEDVDK